MGRAVLATTVLFILVLSGCDAFDHFEDTSDYEVQKTGMLIVVDPCLIPEGCGPKYRLVDDSLRTKSALQGEIQHDDSGLIATVYGRRTTSGAIDVEEYRTHSSIPYHDFLVRMAREYTEENYGCFVDWNKTFRWKLDGEEPYLIVRMTNTFSERKPQPFIELWYNGKTGGFVREKNNLGSLSPCSNG